MRTPEEIERLTAALAGIKEATEKMRLDHMRGKALAQLAAAVDRGEGWAIRFVLQMEPPKPSVKRHTVDIFAPRSEA